MIRTSGSKKMWVESSWNVMAHGDALEGKWRGKWRMEWVASNLHTTSEHGVSSITTADAHISAASGWLNWRPCWFFKRTRPFRQKTKSGFCACAITFQTQSNNLVCSIRRWIKLWLGRDKCAEPNGTYITNISYIIQWCAVTNWQHCWLVAHILTHISNK